MTCERIDENHQGQPSKIVKLRYIFASSVSKRVQTIFLIIFIELSSSLSQCVQQNIYAYLSEPLVVYQYVKNKKIIILHYVCDLLARWKSNGNWVINHRFERGLSIAFIFLLKNSRRYSSWGQVALVDWFKELNRSNTTP